MNRSAYLFIFFLLAFVITSCQQKFKDEDLIIHYIQENSEKFDNSDDFHVLTIRFAPLDCYAQIFGYDVEKTIQQVADSLKTEKLFVLYDNSYAFVEVDKISREHKVRYVEESFRTLDAYAFPYTPHVFHIKNNSIRNWQKVVYKFGQNRK